MTGKARHLPLRPLIWDRNEAANAIDDIVSDVLSHFDGKRFWPAHPLDDFAHDGQTCIYFGAAGVIWALEYLARSQATQACIDFRPVLPHLLESSIAEFAQTIPDYVAHGSLLCRWLPLALPVLPWRAGHGDGVR
jgi:hypothetical protein